MDLHHGHGDMRRPGHEAALRAVHKPPAKPWRGGGSAAVPAPPKVYRVEPREFRDLVQRLTGAPARQQQPLHHHQAVAPAQPMPVRAGEEAQFYAAPWCSFPLLGPASIAGLDAQHGNGALT